MKYKVLGSTGLQISQIGFGCWGIGGNSYGKTDDDVSKEALRTAFNSGVSFFDTADFYGFGKSEKLLGEEFERELKINRDRLVFASKFGVLDSLSNQDFSIGRLEVALEGSLIRLKSGYIDLYQLHSPAPDVFQKEKGLLEKLKSFQKSGKIRALGVSVRRPEDGIWFIQEYGIECIQVNFNLLDQRAIESGLFNLAAKANVGIIARTPLCFGFLSGKYDSVHFASDDHRSLWPAEQRSVWCEGMHKFFTSHRFKTQATEAQFALNFCLSHETVTTSIPGMLNKQHVVENAVAGDLERMSAEEISNYFEIYRTSNFFVRK